MGPYGTHMNKHALILKKSCHPLHCLDINMIESDSFRRSFFFFINPEVYLLFQLCTLDKSALYCIYLCLLFTWNASKFVLVLSTALAF